MNEPTQRITALNIENAQMREQYDNLVHTEKDSDPSSIMLPCIRLNMAYLNDEMIENEMAIIELED